MNLIFAKNLRLIGADGEIIRGALQTGKSFEFICIDREGVAAKFEKTVGRKITLVPSPSSVGSFFARIFYIIKLFFHIKNKVVDFGNDNLENAIAGSPELALVLELANVRAEKKYYLLSDLTRFHSGKLSFLTRFLEKFIIRNGWTPVVTSPGFYNSFYKKLDIPYQKIGFVHNKPQPDNYVVNGENSISLSSLTLNIVWAGRLRCSRSLSIMHDMLDMDANADQLRFDLHGVPCFSDNLFWDKLLESNNKNFKFHGVYQQEEILRIHGNANYIWGCDWELDINSMSLIANRLYYACFAKVPIIVSDGSFMANIVNTYGIGISISTDAESAFAKIKGVGADEYKGMVENLGNIESMLGSESSWHHIINGNPSYLNDSMLSGFVFGNFVDKCLLAVNGNRLPVIKQ